MAIEEDSLCFFYDKMCQKKINIDELKNGGILVKQIYARYSPSNLENRLVFFGWCKK